MGYEGIGKLIDRWFSDPMFRQNLRQDPEGTMRKSGMTLSSEEWASFKKVDWALSDEELKNHVSKLFV